MFILNKGENGISLALTPLDAKVLTEFLRSSLNDHKLVVVQSKEVSLRIATEAGLNIPTQTVYGYLSTLAHELGVYADGVVSLSKAAERGENVIDKLEPASEAVN